MEHSDHLPSGYIVVLIVGLLGGGDAVGCRGAQGERLDGPVVLDTNVANKQMISFMYVTWEIIYIWIMK